MKSLRLMDWDEPGSWQEYRICGLCPGEGSVLHAEHGRGCFLFSPKNSLGGGVNGLDQC